MAWIRRLALVGLGTGLIVALVVSILLAGQFVPKFFSTHKVMPAGLMSVLSVLGIVVAIAAWLRK